MEPTSSPSILPAIEHLLLSAPKERRLDLAMAALRYHVTREDALVVEDGKQSIESIWLFSREDGHRAYVYTQKALALFSQPGSAALAPVPRYSDQEPHYEEVVAWITGIKACRLQVSYQLNWSQREITVRLLPKSTQGNQLPYERRGETSSSDWHKELYRLTYLVTLDAYAPQMLPLLDADQAKRDHPASFLEYPMLARAQNVVLFPRWLPRTTLFECMHQQYDAQTETLQRCRGFELDRREGKEHYYAQPCPGCGGYYCQQHFSSTSYWFDCVPEECESGLQEKLRQRLRVCVHCALLPEQDLQHLRATRLAFNADW